MEHYFVAIAKYDLLTLGKVPPGSTVASCEMMFKEMTNHRRQNS